MASDAFQYADEITLSLGNNIVSRIDPWGVRGEPTDYLLPYYNYYSIKRLIFRDGVTRVPTLLAGWYSTPIEEVVLGKDVRTIDEFAFTGFNELRVINTAEIDSIGPCAFAGCFKLEYLNLKNVKYITDLGWSLDNLAYIDFNPDLEYVVSGALGMTKWFNNLTTTTYVGKVLLCCLGSDMQQTDFIVKKGTTQISMNAFDNCKNLRSVTMPASVKYMDAVYYECPSLTNINIADNNPLFKSVDGVAYSKDGKTLVRLPRAVKEYTAPADIDSVAPYAYAYNNAIESIVLPPIKTLPQSALVYCPNLKDVVLPNTLRLIGSSSPIAPFYGCSSLREINIPKDALFEGNSLFYGMNYGGLENVTSLERYNVEPGHPQLKSVDGIVYNNRMTVLGLVPPANPATELTVPESVDSICNYAMSYNKNLRSVMLTNQNLILGEGLFSHSKSLWEVVFPDEVAMYTPYSMFDNCVSLKNAVLPEATTSARLSFSLTFRNCKALESVILPSCTGSLWGEVFYGCSALKSLTVKAQTPPEVQSICTDYDDDGKFIETRYPLFYDVNVATCQLYVPENSLPAYEEATGWKEFYNIKPISGISETLMDPSGKNIYYNLKGQRIGSPATGIVIKNGKKVLIR